MSTGVSSPKRSSNDWLAITLRFFAAVVTAFAILQSLKLVAPDVSVSAVAAVHLIVALTLAVGALFFAVRNRLPQAIIALAAIGLTTWASELGSAQYAGISLVLANVVRPILAAIAIVLALRCIWLGVAAALVACIWFAWAWVAFLSDVVIFFVGAMIYGV